MERYYILLIILGSIAISFLIFSLLISIFLAIFLCNPYRWTRKKAFDWDLKKGWINGIEKVKFVEEVSKLSDGYELHWNYALNGDSKKYVILIHG